MNKSIAAEDLMVAKFSHTFLTLTSPFDFEVYSLVLTYSMCMYDDSRIIFFLCCVELRFSSDTVLVLLKYLKTTMWLYHLLDGEICCFLGSKALVL